MPPVAAFGPSGVWRGIAHANQSQN